MLEYTTKDNNIEENFFVTLSHRIPNRPDFSTETWSQSSYKLTQVLLFYLLFFFIYKE